MHKLRCLDCNIQAGDVVYHHKCADSAGRGARCGDCFNINREEANFKMQYEKYGISTPQMIRDEFEHIEAAAILYMFSRQAYTRSYLPK